MKHVAIVLGIALATANAVADVGAPDGANASISTLRLHAVIGHNMISTGG